ncbi:MAG TPA: cytochrome c biogenesis protein CcdA [Actinomycetota bacterium]|jgi:cytochrome c-type biogenesis protein|nr:cytochrome c biogenesis protein CcdA [Actinomycetota bacterium]
MDPVIADLIQRGLASWWAPGLAFAAGLVSFASPCVFPLVPGYLSFVSGGQAREEQPVIPILLFIAGFAAVFTALGAFTGSVQRFLRSPTAVRVEGLIIVLFGVLMVLYAFRLGWPGLYAERRPLLGRVHPGRGWAFPLGIAFGAGWTPCIGPVLAGVLGIAAAQGGSARGALLLLMYSAGLGLPFLLLGLGIRRLVGALELLKRNYHWIAGVSGAVMVAIGVLIVTDLWVRWLAPLLRAIGRFTPPI